MTLRLMLKHPSAYLPPVMSLLALTTVAFFLSRFGIVRAPDENAAAHIWQLLMAAQVPLVGFFALRWVPRAPGAGSLVLLIQVGAAAAASVPVYLFRL